MQPLSWEQRIKVTDAASRARNTGRDLAEYLNEYGLLATPQWAARVRADTIKDVIAELENASPIELTGGRYHTGSWTAADLIAGIIDRLKLIEAAAREEKWIK